MKNKRPLQAASAPAHYFLSLLSFLQVVFGPAAASRLRDPCVLPSAPHPRPYPSRELPGAWVPVALAVTPDVIHLLSESYGPGGGGAPAAGPGTMALHWRWRFTEFLDNVKAITLLGNPQVACVCGGGCP